MNQMHGLLRRYVRRRFRWRGMGVNLKAKGHHFEGLTLKVDLEHIDDGGVKVEC